jgi:putative oxidoreductase
VSVTLGAPDTSKEGYRQHQSRVVQGGKESVPLSGESVLQRLFSTFPNGWPGLGLLLLRICVGARLIYVGTTDFGNDVTVSVMAPDLIAIIGAVFLLAGLWTPIICVSIAIAQIWGIAARGFTPTGQVWIHVMLALLSACIAMLGPGAWSVDARLFGRKRFDIDRRG